MQNVILVLRPTPGSGPPFLHELIPNQQFTELQQALAAHSGYRFAMTRPLRIQFPGALYHVTTRGCRKALIYLDDTDRAVWHQTLGDICEQFDFCVYAFCQMGNHYHLLVETLDANLARGMRQLNGVYSQYFNRRHDLAGHVFQGRYQAILVDKESYLLEVARYIVLNPVRAKLVSAPQDWRWSSYNFMLTEAASPGWLDTQWLLSKFGGHVADAQAAYRQFVAAGMGGESPFINTAHRLMLGSEAFLHRFQASTVVDTLDGISKAQRSTLAPPLSAYQEQFSDRDQAMAAAYRAHAYTLTDIARHFGVCLSTAARAVKKHGGYR